MKTYKSTPFSTPKGLSDPRSSGTAENRNTARLNDRRSTRA
jgi:hypothetical protein